jgi:hypothetical protein
VGVGVGVGVGKLEPVIVRAIVVVPAGLVTVTLQLAVAVPVSTNVVPGEPEIVSVPVGHALVTVAGPSALGIDSVSARPARSAREFPVPSATGEAAIASADPIRIGATGLPDPPPQAAKDNVTHSKRMPAPIIRFLRYTVRRPARHTIHNDSLSRPWATRRTSFRRLSNVAWLLETS